MPPPTKSDPAPSPAANNMIPIPTLEDCLVNPWVDLDLIRVKWGEDRDPSGVFRWPARGPVVFQEMVKRRKAGPRPGAVDEPTVMLLNMSYRRVEHLLVPTNSLVEGPGGAIFRQWVEKDFEPFSSIGPLPISLAINLMRPDAKDNLAAGTHQTRHLWATAPEGRCNRKLIFRDKEFGNRAFETCPYANCAEHPAEAFSDPETGKTGPAVIWSVMQAQQFGKSLLNEYAIERFLKDTDLRPAVSAYLTWVIQARQKSRRERQGLPGASRVRSGATH